MHNFGVTGYADDLSLIAPCREALQRMVIICEDFFNRHGIVISTNSDIQKTKTKVITFGLKTQPANIMLDKKPLPCVNMWPHLGHLLCADESSVHDLEEKKRTLIGKIHSLRQELSDQDPAVYLKLIRTYLLRVYGGTRQDIFSDKAVQLWSTWHTTIKALFKLPPATHRFLLNHLMTFDHIKKLSSKRFIKFSVSIQNSSNPQMRLLHNVQSRDWRSTYGRNYMNILHEAQVTSLEMVEMVNIVVNPVPPGEEWKINFLHDMLRSGTQTFLLNSSCRTAQRKCVYLKRLFLTLFKTIYGRVCNK